MPLMANSVRLDEARLAFLEHRIAHLEHGLHRAKNKVATRNEYNRLTTERDQLRRQLQRHQVPDQTR